MDFLCGFGYDYDMSVEVAPEKTVVLIRWKKRSDNYVLVRMKAEATLYASRGVDVGIIAENWLSALSGRCRNGWSSGRPRGCARS